MSDEVKNLSLEDLKSLIFGEDRFDIVIENNGHKVKLILRCLDMNDIINLEKILKERQIDANDATLYLNELRLLKIVYAIEKIIVDNVELPIKDRDALEKVLKAMPETVIRVLQLKYDEYNVKIYDMIQKKN